jgi:DNA-binding Lrp family transcriptional regulator
MRKEELKNTLLSLIQKEFPLIKKPFLELAKKLHISENEVLDMLKEEKNNSIIRQISPIYDTKKLGYKSSLVAFKIEKKDIDKAIEIINSHPGISHNYERNHSFNIWFTIAVDPKSSLGLEKTVKLLAKLTNAKEFIILPTLKMFKIQVKLNTTGKDPKREKVTKKSFKKLELTDEHKRIIEKTQYDLPIKSEPFEDIVKELGISYEELFTSLQKFKDAGIMRRFAAILNHRKAGFNANAMVVWDIDEKKGEDIGKKVATFSAVSHCYLRPKYPNWPYNLFTMIHGKTTEETNSIVEDMAKEIEFKSKMLLYSTKEFKKQRIIYFTNDFHKWEKRQL